MLSIRHDPSPRIESCMLLASSLNFKRREEVLLVPVPAKEGKYYWIIRMLVAEADII